MSDSSRDRCGQSHHLSVQKVKRMPHKEKVRELLKYELCLICLKAHPGKRCESKLKCYICDGDHLKVMHNSSVESGSGQGASKSDLVDNWRSVHCPRGSKWNGPISVADSSSLARQHQDTIHGPSNNRRGSSSSSFSSHKCDKWPEGLSFSTFPFFPSYRCGLF